MEEKTAVAEMRGEKTDAQYRCVDHAGVGHRSSKEMSDRHTGGGAVMHNEVIEARDDGNGWLTVSNVDGSSDQLFLPTKVAGIVRFERVAEWAWSEVVKGKQVKISAPTYPHNGINADGVYERRLDKRYRSMDSVCRDDCGGKSAGCPREEICFGKNDQYQMHEDRSKGQYGITRFG